MFGYLLTSSIFSMLNFLGFSEWNRQFVGTTGWRILQCNGAASTRIRKCSNYYPISDLKPGFMCVISVRNRGFLADEVFWPWRVRAWVSSHVRWCCSNCRAKRYNEESHWITDQNDERAQGMKRRIFHSDSLKSIAWKIVSLQIPGRIRCFQANQPSTHRRRKDSACCQPRMDLRPSTFLNW